MPQRERASKENGASVQTPKKKKRAKTTTVVLVYYVSADRVSTGSLINRPKPRRSPNIMAQTQYYSVETQSISVILFDVKK